MKSPGARLISQARNCVMGTERVLRKPATVALILAAITLAVVSAPAAAREPGERSSLRKSERIVHARKAHRVHGARKDKGEFPLLAPIKALVKLIIPPSQPEKTHGPRRPVPRAKASMHEAPVARDMNASVAEPIVPSRRVAETHGRTAYDAMIARHAAANAVPADLVHRIIMRESRYNPRAANKGNYGIMQIRLRTARAMGYKGGAEGLLDPDTNMTYAVRYLAGAYKAARGNSNLALAKYSRGYN
jgi:transglycosylase-like protein with SLT domain